MNPKQLKIVYLGSSDISVEPLKTLIENCYKITALITQPDKSSGRKKAKISKIKVFAEDKGLKVFEPLNKDELDRTVEKLRPDLAIVFSYGIIIKAETLAKPKYGFINIHPSLIPRYRGPSPIQTALLNGDNITGVSILKVMPEMDAGPILMQKETKLEKKDNLFTLENKLSKIGSELLIKTLENLDNLKGEEQNDSEATYTKIFKKEDGKIDWFKSAEEINNMTRAFSPWPSAFTILEGKVLKILETEVLEDTFSNTVGEIKIENNEILVQTGKGVLEIKKIQLEGKNPVSVKEFINGYPNLSEKILVSNSKY